MSVASHLGIDLREYDRRIRTFIPRYEEMLDEAAGAIDPRARTIVDLGVGTGALSARCLTRAKAAHVIGIDDDQEILAVAQRRLKKAVTTTAGDFVRVPLPRADAVVASFALHHVRTRAARLRLLKRVRAALGRGGMFVSADCHPSGDRVRRDGQRRAWLAHLRRTYSPREASALLAAWAREDVYIPLDAELALLQRAGFKKIDVIWRRDAFAVIACS